MAGIQGTGMFGVEGTRIFGVHGTRLFEMLGAFMEPHPPTYRAGARNVMHQTSTVKNQAEKAPPLLLWLLSVTETALHMKWAGRDKPSTCGSLHITLNHRDGYTKTPQQRTQREGPTLM